LGTFGFDSGPLYKYISKGSISGLIQHHAMKAYWGSGGIAPGILNLGTRRRWVISFTLRPCVPHVPPTSTSLI
jgi:hypothetical protein